MSEPTGVSVCISSYNHARYLRDCLDSILNQTYQNFEIVIVDDGSQDGSHELLMDYQSRYPEKIRYSWHPGHTNQGISITSNRAIEASRGKYVAWIGSDDRWQAEKLEQQAALLEEKSEVGVVYCYAEYIDEDGKRLDELAGVDITRAADPVSEMVPYCQTPAMTVMVRRECLDAVGLFDESLVYSDWDLMIRILAHWDARFIGQPLALYRKHGANTSMGIDPKVDLERTMQVMCSLRSNALAIGGRLARPRNLALLDLHIAFLLFCAGNEEDAVIHLRRAFEDDPTLEGEEDFFNNWLTSWKPDYYTSSHSHFGFWALSRLPAGVSKGFRDLVMEMQLKQDETYSFFVRRGIHAGQTQQDPAAVMRIFDDVSEVVGLPAEWKGRVLKSVYPALLFESFQGRKYPLAWRYWTKALLANPAMAKNRGVWSIGLQSFLGAWVSKTN